jgi:hypothetical protein
MWHWVREDDFCHDFGCYLCKFHGNSSAETPSIDNAFFDSPEFAEGFKVLSPLLEAVAGGFIARTPEASLVDCDDVIGDVLDALDSVNPAGRTGGVSVDEEHGGGLSKVLRVPFDVMDVFLVWKSDKAWLHDMLYALIISKR